MTMKENSITWMKRKETKLNRCSCSIFFFFLKDPATTEISPLPLHAALPISAEPAVLGLAVARAGGLALPLLDLGAELVVLGADILPVEVGRPDADGRAVHLGEDGLQRRGDEPDELPRRRALTARLQGEEEEAHPERRNE